MTHKYTLSRRDAIKSVLAVSAAGALAACSQEKGAAAGGVKTTRAPSLKYASEGAYFTPSEMTLIAAFAGTIMPATDTPGAVDAGVPESLQDFISNWGDDNVRSYWRAGLRDLGGYFKSKTAREFTAASDAQKFSLLSAYDNDVFTGKTQDQFYKDMKSTITRAYYMSEAGASEELNYDPVPGDWEGCVPLSDVGKAWAT